MDFRHKGYEGQGVIPLRVDQIVDTQSISHTRVYHEARIVDQVIGGNNMRGWEMVGKKRLRAVAAVVLVGYDQGQIRNILWGHEILSGERGILPHQHPESFVEGQLYILIAGTDLGLQHKAHIQQSFVQPFGDRIGVTAEKMEPDLRILCHDLLHHLDDGIETV